MPASQAVSFQYLGGTDMEEKDAETGISRYLNPIILPHSETVMQASREMHSRHISAVLVTEEGGKLVGIFTGRDAVSRVLAQGKDPAKTTLGEVMSYSPTCISTPAPAAEALRFMQQANCRHLPVVDDGKVVGLISRGDFRPTRNEHHGG
jgi:CBS domain-containing protein